MSRRKVVLQISKDKESRAVHQTYTEMTANYQANLRAVEALLAQLVRHEGGDAWALRDIDDDALDRIVADTKRTVARFYLQSIIDFQRLLHAAKSMPSITVD
jgi:phytoene/squalene synthetase